MSAFETAVNDIAIALDIAATAQAETGLGGTTAVAVIAVARAAVHALQGIAAGNVTVSQVATEESDLKTEMQGGNEDADNALADKFPVLPVPAAAAPAPAPSPTPEPVPATPPEPVPS